jgi:phage terminase large subunit-like protein
VTSVADVANWSAADKKRALEVARARANPERKAWYCTRGRICDGKPHKGFEYPHARGDQWPPREIDWLTWLILSGRGSGKTRTGSEWVRTITKYVPRIALIGRRGPDVRGTMVEGESGLIAVCERAGVDYDWQPSKKEFTFGNGAKAFGYSAEEPDTLRGPQHGAAWADEPAHFDLIEEVWDNLLFGLRLPGLPGGAKILATSTPVPSKWVKATKADRKTIHISVPTYINLDNLDPTFRQNILDKYEGTRKGKQELMGQVLNDVEGALWNDTMFQKAEVGFDWHDCERIVVAIDPAGTKNKRSDETGIVVVGLYRGCYYVLHDATGKYTPNDWANKAIDLHESYEADCILAEKNYGGDMVKATIDNALKERKIIARVKVATAQKSKKLRAEPVVGLYEQQKVKHYGNCADIEDEMCTWIPGKGDSPNRVDATVWAIGELAGEVGETSIASPVGRAIPRTQHTRSVNSIPRRRIA